MSQQVCIYHNPRCSKSRETLQLLESKGITPKIIAYMETPPSREELKAVLLQLGLDARALMRTGEDDYKNLKLADSNLTEDQLIDAMISHPKLIQRPIVVSEGRAVLGRPPEAILALFQ
jgi:arsenate reductase (glutaredoxin)